MKRGNGIHGDTASAAALYRGAAGVVLTKVALSPLPAAAADPAVGPPTIAVAEFDYTDSSGEARDQRQEHASRLQALAAAVRADLARDAKYQVVPLDCQNGGCSVEQLDPSALLESGRRAGAKFVLYGGLHKMSTLVQWMKAQIVDVATDKVVFDQLVSFRGDSDDAWQHAEHFLVSEIESRDLPK